MKIVFACAIFVCMIVGAQHLWFTELSWDFSSIFLVLVVFGMGVLA